MEQTSNPSGMLSLVGNTPLIRLNRVPVGYKCKVLVKCEFLNPTGSATDRVVKHDLVDAPKKSFRKLRPTVTGGPTDVCVSTAWISTLTGLKSLVVPSNSDVKERADLLEALGARTVKVFDLQLSSQIICPPHRTMVEDIKGALGRSVEVKARPTSPSVLLHYNTTGQEIANQLESHMGTVAMLVCGSEGRGMIFGLNMKLREKNPTMISIGVDLWKNGFCSGVENEVDIPADWYEEEVKGKIEPAIWKTRFVTAWNRVTDSEAYFMARRLAKEEGLLVGPKSGAVMVAALEAIEKHGLKDNEHATVVVVLNGNFWNASRDFVRNDWMLKGDHFQEARMESLYWWWKMPLSDVNLPSVLLLSNNLTAKNVLSTLKSTGSTRGCVLNENRAPVGIITYERIDMGLRTGLVNKDTTIANLCCADFRTLDVTENVCKVFHHLENFPFVLISQRNYIIDEETEKLKTEEHIIGIVDQTDLLQFSTDVEKHHVESYGINLSDGIPSDMWFKPLPIPAPEDDDEVTSD